MRLHIPARYRIPYCADRSLGVTATPGMSIPPWGAPIIAKSALLAKESKMIGKHWGIGLLLGLMTSGLPLTAQSAFEREMKDRAEIEKLMWQYARALDTE